MQTVKLLNNIKHTKEFHKFGQYNINLFHLVLHWRKIHIDLRE